jgi:hypothetical protein
VVNAAPTDGAINGSPQPDAQATATLTTREETSIMAIKTLAAAIAVATSLGLVAGTPVAADATSLADIQDQLNDIQNDQWDIQDTLEEMKENQVIYSHAPRYYAPAPRVAAPTPAPRPTLEQVVFNELHRECGNTFGAAYTQCHDAMAYRIQHDKGFVRWLSQQSSDGEYGHP